jgi:hypothetical protein
VARVATPLDGMLSSSPPTVHTRGLDRSTRDHARSASERLVPVSEPGEHQSGSPRSRSQGSIDAARPGVGASGWIPEGMLESSPPMEEAEVACGVPPLGKVAPHMKVT